MQTPLSKVLSTLSYSHLAELAIAGEGSGQVPEQNIPLLLLRINEALETLYTRFELNKKTLTLLTDESITTYYLDPRYTVSSNQELPPYNYIQDSLQDPFLNDVLMLVGLRKDAPVHCETPTGFVDIPLNDRAHDNSWFNPAPNQLTVRFPVTGELIYVDYLGRHEQFDLMLNEENLQDTYVVLPPSLNAAFYSYVAYLVYGAMSIENAMAKSQNYLDTYEAQCALLEQRNTLGNSIVPTNEKPRQGGWI